MKKLLLLLTLVSTQVKGQDLNAVYRLPRNYTDTQRVIYLVSDTTTLISYFPSYALRGYLITIYTVEKANYQHLEDQQKSTELYYDDRMKPLRKELIVWQYNITNQ